MKLIAIGRVAGAFGVRGEVRITPYGDDPAALVRYGVLYGKDQTVALTLQGGRVQKGGLITRAKEIESKEAADAMRGTELYVDRDAFAAPDEDEFYLTDLIGLRVVHRDGHALGVIKAAPNFGAGDLLEVSPPTGESFYLPFTREAVPEVNLAEGFVIADPPAETEAE